MCPAGDGFTTRNGFAAKDAGASPAVNAVSGCTDH
jgi:hypothetical protein